MKKTFQFLLGVGILAALLAICFFIFHIPDFWPQLLAIIASAFLGVGGTAWVTRSLLNSQQESEEKKEKNIKIYENKIAVYSDFISKLWDTMQDGCLNEEELRTIRSEVFNKLIFYLNTGDIKKLSESIGAIKDLQPYLAKDVDAIDPKKTGELIKNFSKITELLRSDIKKNKDIEAAKELTDLWTNFALPPLQSVEMVKKEESIDSGGTQKNNVECPTSSTEEEVPGELTQDAHEKKEFVQAWHFAMWGDEQITALDKGINELSLVEYEETWRTNLVKQVRENDIVFLFRRGGYGYIGAFKPLGWRIFDFNEQKETIHVFDPQKQVEPDYDKDVQNYDIYNGRDDGADLCSNLIVKPLAFDYKGVSYPGGVYRRSISRYDNGYARILLARFKAKENDPTFNRIKENGEKITDNTAVFDELTQNITPAERDENGFWK